MAKHSVTAIKTDNNWKRRSLLVADASISVQRSNRLYTASWCLIHDFVIVPLVWIKIIALNLITMLWLIPAERKLRGRCLLWEKGCGIIYGEVSPTTESRPGRITVSEDSMWCFLDNGIPAFNEQRKTWTSALSNHFMETRREKPILLLCPELGGVIGCWRRWLLPTW